MKFADNFKQVLTVLDDETFCAGCHIAITIATILLPASDLIGTKS